MQVSDTAPPYLSALQREVLDLLKGSLLPHQQAEPVERYELLAGRGRASGVFFTCSWTGLSAAGW
jgi:hypothetical protein